VAVARQGKRWIGVRNKEDRLVDEDREAMLARARSAGVVGIVTVGCDLEDSRRACETAQTHGLHASIGVHPHEAKDAPADLPAAFDALSLQHVDERPLHRQADAREITRMLGLRVDPHAPRRRQGVPPGVTARPLRIRVRDSVWRPTSCRQTAR